MCCEQGCAASKHHAPACVAARARVCLSKPQPATRACTTAAEPRPSPCDKSTTSVPTHNSHTLVPCQPTTQHLTCTATSPHSQSIAFFLHLTCRQSLIGGTWTWIVSPLMRSCVAFARRHSVCWMVASEGPAERGAERGASVVMPCAARAPSRLGLVVLLCQHLCQHLCQQLCDVVVDF